MIARNSIASFVLLLAAMPAAAQTDQACIIDTVAGGGTLPAGDGGPALEAELINPASIRRGPDGLLYFADAGHFRIRRVTADGQIETVVGTGEIQTSGDGGPGARAAVGRVLSLSFGPDGTLYWLEIDPWGIAPRIRRLAADGVVETIAGGRAYGAGGDGGPAVEAGLYGAVNIDVGPDGSIYVAVEELNRVRRIRPDRVIETFAGTGQGRSPMNGDGGLAIEASVAEPEQVLVGPDSTVYIRESSGRILRRVKPDGTIDTYLAASGLTPADGSRRTDSGHKNASPFGIDDLGRIYWQNRTSVRRIGRDDRFETVWSGGNGESDIDFHVTGVGDVLSLRGGQILSLSGESDEATLAGVAPADADLGDGGPAVEAFVNPAGVTVSPGGDLCFVDLYSSRVRAVRNGRIEAAAGNGVSGPRLQMEEGVPALDSPLASVANIALGPKGELYLGMAAGTIWRVSDDGDLELFAGQSTHCGRQSTPLNCGDGGPARKASLGFNYGLAVDSAGAVYILHFQFDRPRRRLRKVSPDGTISTVSLDAAPDPEPLRVVVDTQDRLKVWLRTPRGALPFVVAEDGTLTAPPQGQIQGGGLSSAYATDSEGNVYVSRNRAIYRIRPDGSVDTIVATTVDPTLDRDRPQPARDARIGTLTGFAMDRQDNLYLEDRSSRRIRRIAGVNECPQQEQPSAPPFGPFSAATGSRVAPGTIFSIFGASLGPNPPVAAGPDSAGRYPTEVAGVKVDVGGLPAPLLFVSEGQINGVLPREHLLEGRTTPWLDTHTVTPVERLLVRVERNGMATAPAIATLRESAPGLFAQGGSLAAALNQDGTVNSPANPAAPGSIIVLFGTGEGQMDPSVPAGQVVTGGPLPRAVLPVSLAIGGEPAEILYTGAAPGLVSGVLQVNARISENQQTLGAVRAVLKIGAADNASQAINVVVGR